MLFIVLFSVVTTFSSFQATFLLIPNESGIRTPNFSPKVKNIWQNFGTKIKVKKILGDNAVDHIRHLYLYLTWTYINYKFNLHQKLTSWSSSPSNSPVSAQYSNSNWRSSGNRNDHSVVTVPVFFNIRWTTQGSQPDGAALKLKSIKVLVWTGALRLVLCLVGLG